MPNMNIFVGRQPILNRRGDIYAYELLYRNSEQNTFPDVDPERATLGVLVNTFLSIGVDQVVNHRLSFINFPQGLLEKSLFTKLDPNQVVIEILEDVEFTPLVISRIAAFREAGFKVALDDYILQKKHMKYATELFSLINFIKVDYLNSSVMERRRVESLKERFPHIALLAEKVETEEDFEDAKARGYTLFQGYFFAKPEIVKSREIPSNIALHFHVIQQLNSSDANIDRISGLIEHDVSLSYKFLRYINSLAFEIPNKVASIRQAIMLMGIDEARKWMQVLVLYDMGQGAGNGRNRALVDYSLSRAKFCELVAKDKGKKNSDEYFLTGMFSLIDAIMRTRLEDILALLPLSDEVTRTLNGEHTEIFDYLELAKAMEVLDLDRVKEYARKIGISIDDLSEHSKRAQRWMSQFD
ncbi:HDOD domain-containing protein [Aciduricibacillus chroicocephali]|uniref:HDOD domain-containing protein n=1 Tax=Aciduricibacillus chroicocephali TaxID=3054939 RepID=A0ABY9KVI5_9BACI|nr:HDOD domain-containing protein [Bacillaceae bacterium 44XB]